MNKKYIVQLTREERSELENLVKKGKTQAYRIKHANIVLAVDADGPGWTDGKTAAAYRSVEMDWQKQINAWQTLQ